MNFRFSKASHACAVLGMAGLLLLAGGCAEAPKAPVRKIELPVYPPPPEEARFYFERTIRSSADVAADDKDGAMRRALTGESRMGEGMEKPYAIAARGGRIYVGDTSSRDVLMFDLNARKFKRIGGNDLRMPLGVDVDKETGNLYVLDATLKKIFVFDGDGKLLRSMAQEIKWSRPVGITVDPARKRLLTVDAGGVESTEHKVRVLDLESGKLLFEIGKRGDGPGDLNLPRDVAVGPDGSLYVVDGGNFRIQVFDKDGKYLKTFGGIGRRTGQFARPKEIASDPQGNLYVVDTAFGNVQIFDPDGQMLLNVGSRGDGGAPGQFILPSGVAVDADGRVYMVDQFSKKVDVFRPAALPATARYGEPVVKAPATTAQQAAPAAAGSAR